jgi:hypothetical protein
MAPISKEWKAMKKLIAMGKASWAGGKPGKKAPVKIKGKTLSETVLEGRQ